MTLPPGISLRLATADDAEAGAVLHAACWREAYGPYAAPGLLAEKLANTSRWAEAWRVQLEKGPPRPLAVTDDGELVGFSVAGPSRDEGRPTPYELYAIYLREAWWGSGVAQELWEAVRPPGPTSLWVLEDNARARGFYRRNGFEPDGGRELYDDLGAWEIRMVRP